MSSSLGSQLGSWERWGEDGSTSRIDMNRTPHEDFVRAIRRLSAVRRSFTKLAKSGLILGNDNHIGDIGEYWVRRYYEGLGKFKSYGGGKNALFDIKLTDYRRVSVKTLTAWSKTGYGTQVRPLDGKNWTILVAVYLREDLFPERIAIVPLVDLLKQSEFQRNAARRVRTKKATKSHPRFQWWKWLAKYERPFRLAKDDLVPGSR
jgi:hypothetical protein